MYYVDNKGLAYAKVNLYLKVVGKDENYHHLEMLNTAVDFYDEIEIERASQNEVISNIMIVDNVLLKVLNYFEEQYQIPKTRVILKKRIFIGAGLGGGTSDAACLIKLLDRYYELKLGKRVLKEICLKFGSDTLFSLDSEVSKVYGRGDKIKKVLPKRYYILLVNPKVFISTAEVFKNLEIDQNASKLDEFYEAYFEGNLALQNALWTNDLEKSALKLSNEVLECYEYLSSIDKNFHMTGSGSTFFLLSLDYAYLKELKEKISKKDYEVILTKTL